MSLIDDDDDDDDGDNDDDDNNDVNDDDDDDNDDVDDYNMMLTMMMMMITDTVRNLCDQIDASIPHKYLMGSCWVFDYQQNSQPKLSRYEMYRSCRHLGDDRPGWLAIIPNDHYAVR